MGRPSKLSISLKRFNREKKRGKNTFSPYKKYVAKSMPTNVKEATMCFEIMCNQGLITRDDYEKWLLTADPDIYEKYQGLVAKCVSDGMFCQTAVVKYEKMAIPQGEIPSDIMEATKCFEIMCQEKIMSMDDYNEWLNQPSSEMMDKYGPMLKKCSERGMFCQSQQIKDTGNKASVEAERYMSKEDKETDKCLRVMCDQGIMSKKDLNAWRLAHHPNSTSRTNTPEEVKILGEIFVKYGDMLTECAKKNIYCKLRTTEIMEPDKKKPDMSGHISKPKEVMNCVEEMCKANIMSEEDYYKWVALYSAQSMDNTNVSEEEKEELLNATHKIYEKYHKFFEECHKKGVYCMRDKVVKELSPPLAPPLPPPGWTSKNR